MFKKMPPILGVRTNRRRVNTKTNKNRGYKKPLSAKSKRLLILTYISSFIFFGMIAGTVGLFFLFAVFSRELPNPHTLLERNTELSTKLYDRNGTPIFEVYGEKNRQLITLDVVAPHVITSTLAIEDSAFYQHQGFSLRGMLRAVRNTITGEGLQGGSTLTQQVVKNALLTQDRTVTRKIKELILSLQLENRYAKDEIIQMYLNETPYGGQNYGILTASRAYFDKDPVDLTVAEAAYLAGLPQRPSYYSYYGSNPEAGLERKNYVLYLMNERGWIGPDGKRYFLSDEDYETARNEELQFQRVATPFKAPHFVLYVKQLLADRFGEEAVEQGGLQVTTSLDLDFQDAAQKIVEEEVEKVVHMNVGNGALVAVDPKTGHILAMVGSKNYFMESQPAGCVSGTTGPDSCLFEPHLNVTIANRQPGSAIKPITYATMLSQGYTAAFPLLDVPTVFQETIYDQPYRPVNYDGRFRGPMSVRKSLGNSLNIPAVKALRIVGIDSMIDQAEKLGISTLKDRERYGLALTLGGGETKLLEMAAAFAAFGNQGIYREPVAILEVKDSKGNVLYSWRDNGGSRAVSEDVAFLLSDILSDDNARSSVFGTGSLLNIPGYQVAVKTGTTDDKRDNYAIGYTPSVSIAVWVGNNNNDRMNPALASGITGATPIWNRAIREFLQDKPNERFESTRNMKRAEVDVLTGMRSYDDFPVMSEWFIGGTEPTTRSAWYQRIEICRIDGLLANNDCIKAGESRAITFIKIMAEFPEWQPYVDRWVRENYDDDRYFPPTTVTKMEFDEDGDVINFNDVYVHIVGFKDGDRVPLEFRLEAEISVYRSVREVRFYQGDERVGSDSSAPYGHDFKFSRDEAGEYEFTVVAEDTRGNKGETTIKLQVG
jgi:membrane peptidoglycan carboxypeptidase